MIMRRLLGLVVLAFSAACDSADVLGPQTLEGEVRSVVTGELIAGASVSYGKRTTMTDVAGHFVLTGLPTGSIEVLVSHDGYEGVSQRVILGSGKNTTTVKMLTKSPVQTTKPSGVGVDSIRLLPVAEPVTLTGPGSIRIGTKVYFANGQSLGQSEVDPTKIAISTTGPVTAQWELGYTGWRALQVIATAPGTGTVTVSYKGKTQSIAINALDLRFKQLSVSTGLGCALTVEGEAWCWGGNLNGALGTSTLGKCSGSACQYGGNDGNPTPLPVGGGQKFSQIATSANYCSDQFKYGVCGRTCALTELGEAWCWGDGMGIAPKRVAAGVTLKSLTIHFGGTFPVAFESCGLDADGRAYCFTATTTTPLAPDMRFKSLSVGIMHKCGVDLSGDAYCWGSNQYANLGIGSADSDAHPSPVKVQTDARFTAIGVGWKSSCALQTTGSVVCWGFVGTQFQNNNCTTSPTGCLFLPQPATGGGAGYSSIAKADYGPEVCAMTSAGAVDCWTNPTNSPTQPFPEAMASIGLGTFNSGVGGSWCGLSPAGLLYCGRMPKPATRFPF
jgi:hypothetical protein